MKLQDYYENQTILITTDLKGIYKLLISKTSACWGQAEIPQTGYYLLSILSPTTKGGKQTIIVCSMDDYNQVKISICYNCNIVSSGTYWINHDNNYCYSKSDDYMGDANNDKNSVSQYGTCSNFNGKNRLNDFNLFL